MSIRARIEADLHGEELALDAVVALLEAGTPLAAWPRDARVALAVALDEPAASAGEQWKIAALRRHLFGADERQVTTVETATTEDRNRAARLRSGLITRIRLRGGRHL